MRIDIVTDTFAPDVNGVSMTLGRLTAGLREKGHLVHVIRSGEGDSEPDKQTSARSLRLPGYKDVKIGLPRPFKFRSRWKKKRPDVIYVATESPLGLSALKAANSLGIPVVCGFHTNFHEYLEQYRLGGLQNAALTWLRSIHSLAEKTLTPSRDVLTMLKSHGFQNVELLARGVDTALFHPSKRCARLRSEWGARPGSPVAIVVGRVAAEKNLELAVKCFEKMRERVPDAQCVVVGDGPVRQKLQESYPWIHFAGTQKGESLARHYASADIFLFPSESETFGNVLLEALASGLISVSYDYAASAVHIRHDDNGLKVPKGDEKAFMTHAQVAMDLRGFSSLRDRAVSSVQDLGWEHVIGKFEAILVDVSRTKLSQNLCRRKKDGILEFRSITISDVHLGIPESKVHELVDFLKHTRCETLYLNGDIIDGWALGRGSKWRGRHTRVIRTILKKMEKEKTEVIYVRGNHDEVLEKVMPLNLGRLKVVKEAIHETSAGKRYLVIHGDGFDSVSTNHRWLAQIGAFAYDSLLSVNRLYNSYRAWLGKEYFSFSKLLKSKVKGAVSFVDRYEAQLEKLARARKCDGIICGHIHTPADKQLGDIHYLNSGDWVESLSAVVEHPDGRFEVLYYDEFLERLGSLNRKNGEGPVSPGVSPSSISSERPVAGAALERE